MDDMKPLPRGLNIEKHQTLRSNNEYETIKKKVIPWDRKETDVFFACGKDEETLGEKQVKRNCKR